MALFSTTPEPYEVFTPGTPPLERHNVYVSREEAERSLKRFLQRNQVPVVWGEYGVGKTSLVQRYFQPQLADGKLVYIASVASLTLPDIFRTILEHLDYRVDVSSTTGSSVGGSGGLDAMFIKASISGDSTESTTSQLVVTSPTDTALNALLHREGLSVVLDEMHKASDELRNDLANWIKATRVNARGFSLVLVGTSTDAGRLVALDHGIDRYVKEMSIPLMNDDEAQFIVDEGFKRLRLKIADDLRERLIRSAAGAPTIVQALCLDVAESAIENGRREVSEDDLKFAVEQYLSENTGRLADHYFKAIETTGTRQYRKQILRAVAITPNDYATMEDIKRGVSEALGFDVPSTTLSKPLRELKDRQYGAILKDVDRDISGDRIHNLTAFTDPMMKSFVRFMNNLDQTGLMPSRPSYSADDASGA